MAIIPHGRIHWAKDDYWLLLHLMIAGRLLLLRISRPFRKHSGGRTTRLSTLSATSHDSPEGALHTRWIPESKKNGVLEAVGNPKHRLSTTTTVWPMPRLASLISRRATLSSSACDYFASLSAC
jgi:hypothetical protein